MGTKYPPLPKVEAALYAAVWFGSILYSSWVTFEAGKAIAAKGDDSFEDGWPFLNRKRDVSDFEWNVLTSTLYTLLPFFYIYIVVGEICREIDVELVWMANLLITHSALYAFFPSTILLYMLIISAVLFCAPLFKSKALVWIVGIATITCVIFPQLGVFQVDPSLHHTFIFVTSWLNLKGIQFGLSEVKVQGALDRRLKRFLSYAYYFPTFFVGPVLYYPEFIKFSGQPNRSLKKRLTTLVMESLRFLFWTGFYLFCSHFFYPHAFTPYMDEVMTSPWILGGLGLYISLYFYLVYLIIYGISGVLCQFDGHSSLPPPQCVLKIVLYSRLWKTFDVGFYLFMLRYIYKPVLGPHKCGLIKKIFASSLCFMFVYLWHGAQRTLFFWSLFNFLGVTLEAIGKEISSSSLYLKCEGKLSLLNRRRFHALIFAPMWIMGIISSFFFFGGEYFGFCYISYLSTAPLSTLLIIWCISYCMVQVSIGVEQWEGSRKRKIRQ